MFAPKVAKPQTKAAASSKNSLALMRSGPVAHRTGYTAVELQVLQRTIGNQATLQLLAQRARNLTGNVPYNHDERKVDPENSIAREAPPGPSWDFSKIPVFPSGRANRPQPPSSLAATLPGAIPAKLAVGRVDDPLEHEADSIADQVMRISDAGLSIIGTPPQLSRKCAACEEELQKEGAGAAQVAAKDAPAIVHEILHSPGQPLDDATRAYFEPRFGHDFSQVRVHTDAEAGRSARGLNAHAYTLGQNIVFASGRFHPRSREGQRLIAHELTHVVKQQNAGAPALQRKAGERDVGGEKVAVILLRWERNLDGGHFVDRLVAAVSRTAAFRGVPRDYIRAALMVPGLAFFDDHLLRFKTGQSVQLRIIASFEDGDLRRMWIKTVEPAAPQRAEQGPTTQKPTKAEGVQPPAAHVSQQEASGLVTVRDGRVVSVKWLEPQPDAPDPRRIEHLIRSEVIQTHWGAEPADDSRWMAFVRSPGEKWFLRRGFGWPRKQTMAAPAPAPTGCSESDPNYAQCIADEIHDINRNLARIGAKGIEIGVDPLSTPLSKVNEMLPRELRPAALEDEISAWFARSRIVRPAAMWPNFPPPLTPGTRWRNCRGNPPKMIHSGRRR
jgi:hypothetical protein